MAATQFNQNYYLTWENGELVTADTMSAFSDGVATQVLALTNGILPVILSGGIVNINGDSTINVTEGYYRIANQQFGDLEIPGYFYAPAVANLTVNNGQSIVARISITTISQYTTVVSGNVIVADTPTSQDIVLYASNNNGSGITTISRANDLQLIIPAINKSNQLIINNSAATSLQIDATNQQVLILAIAQNATVLLPNATSGIYSIINSSNTSIYLVPSSGYTIFGKTQYLITPGSTVELMPISLNQCWVFM